MSDQSNDQVEDEFLGLARNGKVEEIESILSENPSLDINCKGKSKSNRGWTALHLSTYFGHLETVGFLLERGVNPDIKNFTGDTALHKAAFTSREDVIHKLLDFEASAFMQNDERCKPIDVCCNSRIKEILRVAEKVQEENLLQKLITAAKEGNVDQITSVLSYHPEIVHANSRDALGNTPLHYAAMRGKQNAAVSLLHQGGDASVTNKEGYTAIDMCKTMQLKRILEVQPIKNPVKSVQRFEGFLYKKHFMRHRLQWVVLDKGVLSYFARHADAVTGSKRRMFKYLTDAEIVVSENNSHSFQIRFFDDSIHYLHVKKSPESYISRQKWVHAFQLHINHSSHYVKVGRLSDSDSEDDEDQIIPLVDIKNTVETGFAHHELLKKHVDEFAVMVHKLAISDTSQTAQLLLGKCHQILSISNEMTSAFSSCLKTICQQDQVRKIQLSQEKEKTRVWQQAFEALAAEHHNLERSLSHHSRASFDEMSVAADDEGTDFNGRSGMMDFSSVSDDDEFYDAESEENQDFESGPLEVNNSNSTVPQISSSANNGHIVRGTVSSHYKHQHTELHITRGLEETSIVDDNEILERTVNSGQLSTKTHLERKIHMEKEVRRKSVNSDNEVSTPSTNSDNLREFEDCEDFMYRRKLPVVMLSRDDFSIWSILKQCIGKELSKITMPVIFNETLSFLQRLCEYMEYTSLIKKACETADHVERLQYVAAFSVSALASQLGRVGKPYNPLLGETYEYNRPDLGFRWVSEQVSHHPPVSAFHATGVNSEFEFHGTVHPKLKFWGRSVEVEPKGVMTLTLKKFGETYTWSNPHASVHNVVVGKPWIEQHGVVEIVNHSTKNKCILNFKSHSWFRSDLNKVEGYIINPNKKKIRYLEGDWTSHLYSLSPEAYEKYKNELGPHKGKDKKSSKSTQQQLEVMRSLEAAGDDCVKVWEAIPRPSYSKDYYSFTSYAMTLNEMTEEDKAILPPTDTRRRPDINCQENGNIDGAGDEKYRLEEKQRAARKLRHKKKEDWNPRWFRNAENPVTKAMDWLFDAKYMDRDWISCPDIF